MIMRVKTVLLTMCKKYDECFETIKQVINQGYAFPLHFERYKPLQQKHGYKNLLEQNNRLFAEINSRAKAEYEVHLPEKYDPEKKYPIFIALHGDGVCNIKEFSQYWKPDVFLANNFIFVYIQSSQAICHNGYGWLKDLVNARRDIKECYDSIVKSYSVNESTIFIGGFSGGAIATIDFIMSNVLPIKGFICLCPHEKPETFSKENVELAAARGVKGIFMEGELELPIECEEEMLREFDEAGLCYAYYINNGVGHRAPDDFDDKLRQALNFVLS